MRLLIAHGSQAAQETLAGIVQRSGDEALEIVTASEGSEALELLLQDDPPEVALVDWDLPGIEGPEMCRLVRDFHHGRDTWLVVLAASRHTDTADAWRAGAAKCITTPASPGALRASVEEGLRKMRAPQAPLDDAGATGDEAEPSRGHADETERSLGHAGAATLDAVRPPDGNDDFFGIGGPELRATVEPDPGLEPAATDRPEPDENRGAALLQAVLSER